jgi:Cu/Ag efflux pump CusA
VRGRDLGSVYADVKAALDRVEFPHGYYPELLGEYTERQAAQRRTALSALVAAIGIFPLLQASLGSAGRDAGFGTVTDTMIIESY